MKQVWQAIDRNTGFRSFTLSLPEEKKNMYAELASKFDATFTEFLYRDDDAAVEAKATTKSNRSVADNSKELLRGMQIIARWLKNDLQNARLYTAASYIG